MDYFKYKTDDFIKLDQGFDKVLGVDIQPEKACIFNCIVCNRGKTVYNAEWHDFGPIDASLQGLKEKIAAEKPDIVEIYGQGDILTNVHLEEIIHFVHSLGLPVRLLTNCYLLGIGEHMRIASLADEVMGAFGIVDEEKFQNYHRPLPALHYTAGEQCESIVRFSNQYKGRFILRVFLSKDYNDSDEDIAKLGKVVSRTKYDTLWVATTNKLSIEESRVNEIRAYLDSISYKGGKS